MQAAAVHPGIAPSDMQLVVERRLWIAAYAFAILSPLLIMVLAPHGIDDPTLAFAIAIGFVTYAGMALQVVVASRAPAFSVPVGMDTLLRLHRAMGPVLVVLVAIHVGVVFALEPWARSWVFPPPIHGPLVAQFGFVGFVSMLGLAAISIRRPRWLGYEAWRAWHLALTLTAIGGAYGHILLASPLSSLAITRVWDIAMVLMAACALIYLRVGRVFALGAHPYVVVGTERERGSATTVKLAASGHPGLPLAPGQFAWLRIGGSAFSLNEHPFSLSSSATDPAHPEFTIKESGDFTGALRDIAPGTRVIVDGPHGAWEPPLPEAGFVLIVAGIGVTPAMSVLRTMAATGDPRPVQLIYGSRTWDDTTFRDELTELTAMLQLELVHVLSQPDASWTGERGRVDRDLIARVLPADAARRNVLVCGPSAMLNATLDALDALSIPEPHIRAERF